MKNYNFLYLVILMFLSCEAEENFSNPAISSPEIVFVKAEPSYIVLLNDNQIETNYFKITPVLINGSFVAGCKTFVCFDTDFNECSDEYVLNYEESFYSFLKLWNYKNIQDFIIQNKKLLLKVKCTNTDKENLDITGQKALKAFFKDEVPQHKTDPIILYIQAGAKKIYFKDTAEFEKGEKLYLMPQMLHKFVDSEVEGSEKQRITFDWFTSVGTLKDKQTFLSDNEIPSNLLKLPDEDFEGEIVIVVKKGDTNDSIFRFFLRSKTEEKDATGM